MSINALCSTFIEGGLCRKGDQPWWKDDADRIVDLARREFGRRLLGVLLFGSQVQGTATEGSDLDVLIVLDVQQPIRRALYRWWDAEVQPRIDVRITPQFVHLPRVERDAGGLWFEVAVVSHVLWERGRSVSTMIKSLEKCIEDDKVRRYWSHGQPYWVRRYNEEQGSGA